MFVFLRVGVFLGQNVFGGQNGQEEDSGEITSRSSCTLHRLRRRRVRPRTYAGPQGAGASRHARPRHTEWTGSVPRRGGAAATNEGLTQQNPYGLVLLHSSALKTMTLGFPTPLRYKRSLNLRVTVNEPAVVQILGNVVHGA